MNKDLELHFSETGDPSFILNENRINLSHEDGKTIAMWSADFSLPLNRKYETSIEANKSGVLIDNENVFVTIQKADCNSFESLTLNQDDFNLVLSPKEVIAYSGAMGSVILGHRGLH